MKKIRSSIVSSALCKIALLLLLSINAQAKQSAQADSARSFECHNIQENVMVKVERRSIPDIVYKDIKFGPDNCSNPAAVVLPKNGEDLFTFNFDSVCLNHGQMYAPGFGAVTEVSKEDLADAIGMRAHYKVSLDFIAQKGLLQITSSTGKQIINISLLCR